MTALRFARKTVAKSLVYFFFITGAAVLVTAVFPTCLLFIHPADRCGKAMRYATHVTFSLMNRVMEAFSLVRVEMREEDAARLRAEKSAIIVANHPSLIDISLLIGTLPHADCIVNSALFDAFIVKYIVRRLYIPNSKSLEETLATCDASLAAGNCLVVFPEGSRTKADGRILFRKGFARIALGTGRPVLPVAFAANDMRGLRKGDPFYRVNGDEPYRFKVTVCDPVLPEAYAGHPLPAATRKMTEDIQGAITRAIAETP